MTNKRDQLENRQFNSPSYLGLRSKYPKEKMYTIYNVKNFGLSMWYPVDIRPFDEDLFKLLIEKL